MYSFLNLEPVHFPMSGSNCCFMTCIQVFQEARQVIWYSHLFKNIPQFVVIHTVNGFSIVNEAEVDAFLEFSCFFYDAIDVGSLSSGSSAFSKSSLNTWKFSVHVLLKPGYTNYMSLLLPSSMHKNFHLLAEGFSNLLSKHLYLLGLSQSPRITRNERSM